MYNKLDHSKNVVEANRISLTLDGDPILENISLEIHQGDYLGVVGPNGAGKTTLLKVMLGLISPSGGEVRLFGKELSKFKEWERVGYVPQKATSFDPNFPVTVEEVVMMGRYGKRGLIKRITAEDKKIAETAIGHVGLTDMKKRLVGELSGGQQQRVFIARALAGEPDIIFLDEPVTGLDTKTQEELYALLKKLNVELGLTLVLVSHDVERLLKEVMHIACINKSLTCHQSPEDFMKETELKAPENSGVKIIGYHK